MPHTPPLCIVGLGLMGGSLALALKQAGWPAPITGVSRNPDTLRAAAEFLRRRVRVVSSALAISVSCSSGTLMPPPSTRGRRH